MRMEMDETTREEILSYVVRAQTRLGDEVEAEKLLDFFDKHSYRSRFYMRAFYLRLYKGDHRAAISHLLKAREVGKYKGSVVGALATCYQRVGNWSKLHRLLQEEERYIDRNPVLLDVYIVTLIAQNKFESAELNIRKLRSFARQEEITDGSNGHDHDEA